MVRLNRNDVLDHFRNHYKENDKTIISFVRFYIREDVDIIDGDIDKYEVVDCIHLYEEYIYTTTEEYYIGTDLFHQRPYLKKLDFNTDRIWFSECDKSKKEWFIYELGDSNINDVPRSNKDKRILNHKNPISLREITNEINRLIVLREEELRRIRDKSSDDLYRRVCGNES